MDFTFNKSDAGNPRAEADGEKKRQRTILLLLLLMVCGFSYLYFFTGIIKPQKAQKPAEPAAKSQMVKMPLPPQPVDTGPGKTETKPSDSRKEPAAPVVPQQPPQTPKTAVAPVAPVVVAPQAAKSPVPPPVVPKEEPGKSEPAKLREEPKKVVATGKAAESKPVAAEKKPEPAKPDTKKAAEQKPEPARPDAKKVAAEPALKPKKIVKAEKPVKGANDEAASGNNWSIQVGSYVLEDALSNDMGRVRKAGLEPVVTPGARKKIVMNRLFLSESADRADAMSALEKLKRHTADAFILDQGGKHAVYAGSYLLDARASSEMERLNGAGFKVSLKRADVAIPSQTLTVGPFKDKKSAEAALDTLKAAGIKAAISRQ